MKGTEKLLTIVRSRSELAAAAGAVFTLVPTKPAVVRANYDGIALFMKVLFNVFGDDGLVSHGSLVTPRQLLKIRKSLSLMRLDAIKLGSSDAASRIEQFAHGLITASDGQTRAIAVVFYDCENPNNSAAVEQEFVKHIKDYELGMAVGETLFDDLGFEESAAYQKARRTVAGYWYPRGQIFRKILGKLARNDASETLDLSTDGVNELRELFRRKILDLGLTPDQYSVVYSGISHSQDVDVEEYKQEYVRHFEERSPSNLFKIGAKAFDLKAILASVCDDADISIPVNRASSKHIDQFLSAGWIIDGDVFKWKPYYAGDRNIPVRIRLKDFTLSKHQRRVLKKNLLLRTEVKSHVITQAECALFDKHRIRLVGTFTKTLLDAVPDTSSNEIKTFTISEGDRLLAASYLVIGKTSTYSTFAMHDPVMDGSSLGILTILKEIEYSILQGKAYYYLGYVHAEPSYYDYKKRFHALESFDGKGNWTNYARLRGATEADESAAQKLGSKEGSG